MDNLGLRRARRRLDYRKTKTTTQQCVYNIYYVITCARVCSRFVRRRFLLLVRSPKNPLNATDLTPAKSIVLCPRVLRLLPQSPTPAPAVKAGQVLNRNSPSPSCFGDTKYCNVKSRYRFDGYLFIIFFSYFNVVEIFPVSIVLNVILGPSPSYRLRCHRI